MAWTDEQKAWHARVVAGGTSPATNSVAPEMTGSGPDDPTSAPEPDHEPEPDPETSPGPQTEPEPQPEAEQSSPEPAPDPAPPQPEPEPEPPPPEPAPEPAPPEPNPAPELGPAPDPETAQEPAPDPLREDPPSVPDEPPAPSEQQPDTVPAPPSPAQQVRGALAATRTEVFFDLDSAELTSSDKATLDAYARDVLASGMQQKIQVDGYASVDGEGVHNMKLSADRARAVIDYLLASGLTQDRFNAPGSKGPTTDFSNDDPRQNRRAVLDPSPPHVQPGPDGPLGPAASTERPRGGKGAKPDDHRAAINEVERPERRQPLDDGDPFGWLPWVIGTVMVVVLIYLIGDKLVMKTAAGKVVGELPDSERGKIRPLPAPETDADGDGPSGVPEDQPPAKPGDDDSEDETPPEDDPEKRRNTKRPYLDLEALRRLRKSGKRFCNHGTPSFSVASGSDLLPKPPSEEIRRANPLAPDAVYLFDGTKGLNYGAYLVIVELDQVPFREDVPGKGGEYFTRSKIPANVGYWTTQKISSMS